MKLNRFSRFMYQPVLPMGKNGKLITGSDAHWRLAKEMCHESTVLLKNDGTLPLKKGQKVCLFGTGAGDFRFGGGGSGMVFADRLYTLADGLDAMEREGALLFFHPLDAFYRSHAEEIFANARKEYPTERQYNGWLKKFKMPLPKIPTDLYQKAVSFGDVALFCVSRYSSEGDLDGDRTGGKGDFDLTDEETSLFETLCRDFKRVVVICNVPGPISVSEYKGNNKVGALLYPLYGGGMSGLSLAEILVGKAYPSGHLQDTLAHRIEDYPGSEGFHESADYVNYTEDIFVGYRYFETFCPEKIVYPFGYGLSYTKWETQILSATDRGFRISVKIKVKNIGSFVGKEVLQIYLSAPQGRLGKAKKVLCSFAKTKELAPNEEQILSLSFSLKDFASFDDLGKIHKSAFVLEQGDYGILLGTNARDAVVIHTVTLKKDIICQVCGDYMAPRKLECRLLADGSLEKLPKGKKKKHPPIAEGLQAEKPEEFFTLAKALETDRLEEFIATLSDDELGEMLYGHEMMNASSTNAIGLMPRYYLDDKKLLPMVPTADGPMGIRARPGRGLSATHFPCETAVSQSWNLPLANRFGKAIAMEAKECNLGIWLAPALNIHRHPRCGRNFEYYSEDPLTSGLFAASVVNGVQSQKIAATVKHFCCNNREYNRRVADSRVSQRALREIYLRGFEIVIKKADPWCLMTSYNPTNGEQGSTNWEAINGILRGEWGYDGVVMTDWRTYSLMEDEVVAGSDVKMPQRVSTVYPKAPKDIDPGEMIRKGIIPRECAIASVRRILKMMSHLE